MLCLLVCLVIAFATRWLFLGRESIWFDEGWTWWLVTQPANQVLRLIRADLVAPAYFYLLHAWVSVFGDDLATMRALSALLLTVALVPCAILGRQMRLSPLAIFSAAALLAVSFMQSQYAREARPYALLALFVLSALACVPTLANRRSWPVRVMFALCVIGGMYTHNVMPFYAACLGLAWLVWPGERPLRARISELAIVTLACVIAYLPWVPILREQTRWMTGNFWVSRPTMADGGITTSAICGVDVYGVTPALWRVFGRSPSAAVLGGFVTAGVGLLALLSFISGDRAARRRALAISLVAFGPMVIVFAYSLISQPIFLGRLFLPSSALVPLVLAAAVDARRVRLPAMLFAIVLSILGVCSTLSLLLTPQKEDWRGIHAYVAALPPSSHRLIVFMSAEGELPFAYYAKHATPAARESRTGTPAGFFDRDPPRTIQRVSSDADLAHLRATLASGKYDEAILVLSHDAFVDPDGITRRWFAQHCERIGGVQLRGVEAYRYRTPMEGVTP